MNHEKWIELADLYAVGALETEDSEAFNEHLESGCELCQFRLMENEAALAGLVQKLPPLQAPEALKSKVLDSLPADFEPAVFQPGFHPVWAVGVWLVLSGFILWGWKTTSLKRHTLEFKRMETSMLARGGVKTVEMKAADVSRPMSAKILWTSKGDCLLMTMGLPRPAKDKIYQLWEIAGDQQISIGTLKVDEHGCGILAIKNFNPQAFEKIALTLEPADGVTSPTGPVMLLGNLH